jgi:hypothetical protein
MIVSVADSADLEGAVDAVAGTLGVTVEVSRELGNTALLLQLEDGSPIDLVLNNLPALQAPGRNVDLNYLEPVQPNDGFRPFDDPEQADPPPDGDYGAADSSVVLVIDTTDDQTMYDTEPNLLIDEDHGHGTFVASIVARSGATVNLQGLEPHPTSTNTSVLASGRWAPMMVDDADIITALSAITDATTVVNLSLGGVGCPSSDFTWGIGERLALAREMHNRLHGGETPLKFVAAAGNNGDDVLHFPAAWRNGAAMVDIANAVGDPLKAEIIQISADLRDAIYAVGSIQVTDQGQPAVRSEFSNCGTWVNAAAYGEKQVGEYPSANPGAFEPTTTVPNQPPQLTYAAWSGTSFATANFSAALISGHQNDNPPHEPTGARELVNGLDC